MGLIISTFKALGGDPASLDLNAHLPYGPDEGVRRLQSRTSWTVGALAVVASAIPFVHVVAVIVEILYLMRRMAQVSWSVGILKGARVDREDLTYILAIWSGAISARDLNMNEIVSAKIGLKGGAKFVAKVPGKLAGKMASKLIAKMAAKTGGKLLTGFLSILGGAISAGVSVYFVNTIVDAAEEYYSAQLAVERRM
jgi:hypothetical protein